MTIAPPDHDAQSDRHAAGRPKVAPTNAYAPIDRRCLGRSFPEVLRQVVSAYSDRIVIRSAGGSMTYDELNRVANRLARAIVATAASPADPVALMLEKDATLFVAALAAMKAGRVYMPIDPALPAPRIEAILGDSGAGLVISTGRHRRIAEECAGAVRAWLDVEHLDRGVSDSDLGADIDPDSPAYILYTSGSTGEPRGVVQTQRFVLHTAVNYVDSLHISPADRMALVPSFGFAAAVKSTYGPLLAGATLYPFDVRREGLDALVRWLGQEGITLCQFSPSVFRQFLGLLTDRDHFPALRLIDIGGEPAFGEDLERFRRRFSRDVLLLNTYGGTEFGPLCEYFMDHRTELVSEQLPVGFPVPDKEVWLLDDEGRDVGCGMPGEIVVRSRYITPGYWRRSDLTSVAIRPDPTDPDRRIYRTGDQGLRLEDGSIVHLGRLDSLVKIRGHRVYPIEVEKHLLALPDISGCAVVAKDDPIGQASLVAYVVPGPCARPTAAGLRRALAGRLPDQLIPSAFVVMESLPLLPTGKVDRQALPLPDWHRRADDSAHVASRNAIEDALVRLWEEVLDVRPIGIADDFFAMGGHSLLAIRLCAGLERLVGARVSPLDLFRAPTIERLARRLEDRGRIAPDERLVPIQPSGSRAPFFSVFGMGDYGDGLRELARRLGPDRPVYGIDPEDTRLAASPERMIRELASSTLHEVRAVQPQGPYQLGGFSFGGLLAFEMARQLEAQGQAVAPVVLFDAYGPNPPGPIPIGRRLFRFLHERSWRAGQSLRVPWDHAWRAWRYGRKLRGLPRGTRLRALAERLREGRSEGVDVVDDARRLDDPLRRAAQSYRRTMEAFPGRIVLFRATRPISDRKFPHDDPCSGWARFAAGGVEVVHVPGSHRGIFEEPGIDIVAAELSRRLDGCRPGM